MLENRLHKRHPLVQFLLDNGIYILIALVMWRLPFWLADHFDQNVTGLTPRDLRGNQALNYISVAIHLYILAILAMSYNLVLGMSGIISFGHAVFFGLPIYIVIILYMQFAISITTSIAVALAIGLLLALLIAVAAFRVKGVYFAMFTLAFAEMFYQLAGINLFRFLTNGEEGVRFSGDAVPEIAQNINRVELYYITAIAMALTFLFIRRLMNSPTGRVILAMRENEERAMTMGYNTLRYKALVIALSGLLGTLSGVLYALHSKGADPTVLGLGWTVEPLLMTIIGGLGTHPGPVIGAALLHLGETFLSKPDLQVDLNFIVFRWRDTIDTQSEWPLALGAVFILIVMVVPYGVVGQINLLWLAIRRWLRRFVYDPIVRSNPKLAAWMEPVTGEPPAVAVTYAELSKSASVSAWAMENPVAAIYSAAILTALLGGLITRDISIFFSLILFFALVTLLPVLLILLYRNWTRITGWIGVPKRNMPLETKIVNHRGAEGTEKV